MVTLRKIETTDVAFMMQLENDPVNWSYTTLCDAPYSREQVEEFIATEPLRFVVDYQGRAAGFVDLYDVEQTCQARIASLALILYPAQMQGRGFGRAAVQEIVRIAHQTMRLDVLQAVIHPENTSAIRFFESCGFAPSGINDEQGVIYSLNLNTE